VKRLKAGDHCDEEGLTQRSVDSAIKKRENAASYIVAKILYK
jgi:hypothetical protein